MTKRERAYHNRLIWVKIFKRYNCDYSSSNLFKQYPTLEQEWREAIVEMKERIILKQ